MHMIKLFFVVFNSRLLILKYFEGAGVAATVAPHSNCCDNCRISATTSTVQFENVDDEGRYDYTTEAEIFLRVCDLMNGHSGLNKIVSIIRGSNQRNISSYHGHQLHGAGKQISEDYWRALSQLLVSLEFLSSEKVRMNFYSYEAIELTTKAKSWLSNAKRSLLMRPPNQMVKFLKRKSVVPLFDISGSAGTTTTTSKSFPEIGGSQDNLAHKLQMCRFNLAAKYDVMPYMIASNLALAQLERLQPLTLNELVAGKLDGFSAVKIQKFGPALLRCLMEHKKLLPAGSAFVLVSCLILIILSIS